MTDAFSAAAAAEGRSWTYQRDGPATRLLGQSVTPDFFRVFNVTPALGRFFNDADRESLVLSHEMWRAQFGGDPSVLGSIVTLDNVPHRIVGVAPEDFRFPASAGAWSPLILSSQRLSERGNNMNLLLLLRRRAGTTAAQASGRVDRYFKAVLAEPASQNLVKLGYGVRLETFAVYLAGDLRQPLWLLWTAALVVLLTGCANVAGLLLTRSAGRRKEMAIRVSLGATGCQVVRQLLLESLLLGALGGVAGLAMAWAATLLIQRIPLPGHALLAMTTLDGRLLLYGFSLALASGILFGLAPAIQMLRETQTSGMTRARRHRFQDAFVTAEIACAFVLVVMTGLLLRSLWNVQQIDTGFDPQHLTTAYLTKPRNDPTFINRLQTALQNAPGVESAALAFPSPFTTGGLTSSFTIRHRTLQPGEPEWHGEAYFVTPGYLRTLRIPLLRGRNLTPADTAAAPTVCLIDRKTAELFWPNQDPLGHEIAMYKGWAQIVGIVGNTRADGLEDESRPVVYYSLDQVPFFPQAAAIVRAKFVAGNLIRQAAATTNAGAPVYDIRTMQERIGESIGVRRVLATMLSVFGAITLLLATIGIYGVIAQVVAERTAEVGIRMALGAQPALILRQFMRQGLAAGALGLVFGAAATTSLVGWLQTLLYGVKPLDAGTIAVAGLGITIVLALAVWWPARRAAKIDPQLALRHE